MKVVPRARNLIIVIKGQTVGLLFPFATGSLNLNPKAVLGHWDTGPPAFRLELSVTTSFYGHMLYDLNLSIPKEVFLLRLLECYGSLQVYHAGGGSKRIVQSVDFRLSLG